MKNIDWTKWSAIAEVFSAVAIVVTLIYLSIQTQYLARQTEQNNSFLEQGSRIAQSEMYLQGFANHLATNNSIAEHPEIFAKGNSGQELNPGELASFERQVFNLNTIAYSAIQVDLLMQRDDLASIDVAEFALYLKQNPGAYQVWLEREQMLAEHRRLLNPDQMIAESWMEQVQSAIMAFENAESP